MTRRRVVRSCFLCVLVFVWSADELVFDGYTRRQAKRSRRCSGTTPKQKDSLRAGVCGPNATFVERIWSRHRWSHSLGFRVSQTLKTTPMTDRPHGSERGRRRLSARQNAACRKQKALCEAALYILETGSQTHRSAISALVTVPHRRGRRYFRHSPIVPSDTTS